MGVAALWQLLRSEELVEWYRGGITEEHAALVAAVDGQAVAIDLSTWIMQARQGQGPPCCCAEWHKQYSPDMLGCAGGCVQSDGDC